MFRTVQVGGDGPRSRASKSGDGDRAAAGDGGRDVAGERVVAAVVAVLAAGVDFEKWWRARSPWYQLDLIVLR